MVAQIELAIAALNPRGEDKGIREILCDGNPEEAFLPWREWRYSPKRIVCIATGLLIGREVPGGLQCKQESFMD